LNENPDGEGLEVLRRGDSGGGVRTVRLEAPAPPNKRRNDIIPKTGDCPSSLPQAGFGIIE
jgi:hypothetical protein